MTTSSIQDFKNKEKIKLVLQQIKNQPIWKSDTFYIDAENVKSDFLYRLFSQLM